MIVCNPSTSNWKYLVPALLLFTTFSCRKSDNSEKFATQFLIKCWTHSYEEESTSGEKIYRPCDFTTFPISRFREKLTFRVGGSVEYYEIAANDAHLRKEGTWELTGDGKIIVINDQDGQMILEMEIERLEKDLLIVRPR